MNEPGLYSLTILLRSLYENVVRASVPVVAGGLVSTIRFMCSLQGGCVTRPVRCSQQPSPTKTEIHLGTRMHHDIICCCCCSRLSSYSPPQYFPSDIVKLFVNNIEFKDLPDVRSRPRGALMAAAATVTCANCGNVGHHARGCAMPSNGIIYDSDEERRRKDAKEIKETKYTFGEMAGEVMAAFFS